MFHLEEIQEKQEETTPIVENEEVDLKQENQLLKQKVRQLTGENNRWEKKISNLNKKVSFWENQDLISNSLDKIKIKDEFKSYFAKEVIKKDENFYSSLKENKLDDYFKSLKSNKTYSAFFNNDSKEAKKDLGMNESLKSFLNSLPPQKKEDTNKEKLDKYKSIFTKIK